MHAFAKRSNFFGWGFVMEFKDLPVDIVSCIAKHFSFQELFRYQLVCKFWRKALTRDHLYLRFDCDGHDDFMVKIEKLSKGRKVFFAKYLAEPKTFTALSAMAPRAMRLTKEMIDLENMDQNEFCAGPKDMSDDLLKWQGIICK